MSDTDMRLRKIYLSTEEQEKACALGNHPWTTGSVVNHRSGRVLIGPLGEEKFCTHCGAKRILSESGEWVSKPNTWWVKEISYASKKPVSSVTTVQIDSGCDHKVANLPEFIKDSSVTFQINDSGELKLAAPVPSLPPVIM